ncbi:hypothetical protein PM082_013991 [Marasmius tenuissimus]|nr:hypothetical protein PM082_013991 [Marasmius tenuissimus]
MSNKVQSRSSTKENYMAGYLLPKSSLRSVRVAPSRFLTHVWSKLSRIIKPLSSFTCDNATKRETLRPVNWDHPSEPEGELHATTLVSVIFEALFENRDGYDGMTFRERGSSSLIKAPDSCDKSCTHHGRYGRVYLQRDVEAGESGNLGIVFMLDSVSQKSALARYCFLEGELLRSSGMDVSRGGHCE